VAIREPSAPGVPSQALPAASAADPLAAELSTVRGVGPKRADALRERGLVTLGDALAHLPRRYLDLRRRDSIAALREGIDAVVEGRLEGLTIRARRYGRFRSVSRAWIRDAAGARLRVVWFNLPPYAEFPTNEPVLVIGRVAAAPEGGLQIVHPEVHRLAAGEAPAIRPIYALPAGVPQRLFGEIVAEALRRAPDARIGAIPAEMRARENLLGARTALARLHLPPPDTEFAALADGATDAHRVLALDEMFAFQLALARDRVRSRARAGAALERKADDAAARFLAALPFRPTAAQIKVILEIDKELASAAQMNRLLLGDVGSGKTLIAFWAALRAAESGWQAAIMAPTELLAEQHFRNFQRIAGGCGYLSALLTASVAGAERTRLLRALERGEIPIVFGTHALIQRSVRLARLGLAVIDEQHRFGVFDRARLLALGAQANVLLMTATPIPRSLALALFRNLDVSILDEMPPGRAPIVTRVLREPESGEAHAAIRTELAAGHRAYCVAPLIEDDEDGGGASVAALAKNLARALPGARIGTMHGRMRAAEKERVMRDFRDGRLDVIAATTIIEVGIDVPEATVIVVTAAERYGLAQLHQLRGRVGRGGAPGRCFLIASANAGGQALARLETLARSSSGADVAHEDLRLRGPGDLLGSRQSGALALSFAAFIRDPAIISRAADLATEWLTRDPKLELESSAGARSAIRKLLNSGFSLGDIG
jgi:ATP-dependent DNA helicase RecG